LTDVARNTIVIDDKLHIAVKKELEKLGAVVKTVGLGDSPMGYTGLNAKIMTKAGMLAEIQVNSAKMIYAKETEVVAKSIIGEKKWNEIAAKTKLPCGLGHKLYEEYRVAPAGDPRLGRLEAESTAYYNQIRERG